MTFNFTPSLLEQLLHPRTDPFTACARKDPSELRPEEKIFILRHFFAASWENQVRPLPRYFELLVHRGMDPGPEDLQTRAHDWSSSRFLDLQVLFHLAWCGEHLRRLKPIQELLRKGRQFTAEDKQHFFEILDAAPAEVVPLYRKLAERGQVSLTTTPYNHPILPMLTGAREIQQDHPGMRVYPFPADLPDARWHVEEALRSHEALFGRRPRGIWPAEGGISESILPLLDVEAAFSDDLVLYRSQAAEKNILFPFRHPAQPSLKLFFRNSELSNRFGFVYGGRRAEQAVEDFIHFVDNISSDGVLWVILDGENPWGGYHRLGRPFLRRMFTRASEAGIRFLNLDDVLALDLPVQTVDHLHPGSWIDASFHIWTGDPVKNRAWDLLSTVRQSLSGVQAPEISWTALRAAQASDWFWWYGRGNESPYKPEFDMLFRHYLKKALADAGQPPIPTLESPLELEESDRLNGRPKGFMQPLLDGKVTSFYEWSGAAKIPVGSGGSMHASGRIVEALYLGFDSEHLFLRLDPDLEVPAGGWMGVKILLRQVHPRQAALSLLPAEAPVSGAYDRVLEVRVPFSALGLKPGDEAGFYLDLLGDAAGRCPWTGLVHFTVPHAHYEEEMWNV
jgi:alpha-amylase/alpha-mannosidase (GH57 family)